MKEIIKKIINSIGYTIVKKKKRDPQREKQISRENFFDLYFSQIEKKNFFFVQIGGNDGKTNDPIYPYVTGHNLRGIVVEPQPKVFELLQENYQHLSGVECVNVAIANKSGTIPFYTAKTSFVKKESRIPATHLASLKRDTLRYTLGKRLPKGENVDDYIEEISVRAITFEELLSSKGVKRVDFIQLDCEGYDFEILKTFNFGKFSPTIINFETNHLSDTDRNAAQKFLEERGYKWFTSGIDTCAYRV